MTGGLQEPETFPKGSPTCNLGVLRLHPDLAPCPPRTPRGSQLCVQAWLIQTLHLRVFPHPAPGRSWHFLLGTLSPGTSWSQTLALPVWDPEPWHFLVPNAGTSCLGS
jgi:hypothetical protein